MIITPLEFENGKTALGVPFNHGEVLTVDYGSHQLTIVFDAIDYSSIPDYSNVRPISVQEFRDRFDIFTLTKLDKLENCIENDNIVLQLCYNLTIETLEPYRSYIRTTIKTLYNATGDNIYLDSAAVKDGMNLLLQVGVIDLVTHTNVLDTTTVK